MFVLSRVSSTGAGVPRPGDAAAFVVSILGERNHAHSLWKKAAKDGAGAGSNALSMSKPSTYSRMHHMLWYCKGAMPKVSPLERGLGWRQGRKIA